MHHCLLTLPLLFWYGTALADNPTARDLILRFEKELSPIWVDGDTATFFYRGEEEQVTLLIGGEQKPMRNLPKSDVWTTTVTRPGMAKAVFNYAFLPGKKGESALIIGMTVRPQPWRGPKAPPAAAKVTRLEGQLKVVEFDSKALGESRRVIVYLPPGHDPTKTYPVIYATDSHHAGNLLEPLITAGKVPPLIAVAASSPGYKGEQAGAYDLKKDVRASEYVAGLDADRYRKHETFFCEELPAWAEKEFGASKERKDRAIHGFSNGGRFAVDIALKRPNLYAHVFAFSLAGRTDFKLVKKPANPPHFHLAAGTWEKNFHKITSTVADALKRQKVPTTFVTRVAGHDFMMWEDELATAVVRAFGTPEKADEH